MKTTATIVILFLLSVSAALAGNGRDKRKGDASIQGSVADAATKKPVAGVTVSISGKGNERRELATDVQGVFKSSAIAPGEVTITLEKKGYQTCRKEGVSVREGTTLKISMEMDEEEVDEGVFHPLLRMVEGF